MALLDVEIQSLCFVQPTTMKKKKQLALEEMTIFYHSLAGLCEGKGQKEAA